MWETGRTDSMRKVKSKEQGDTHVKGSETEWKGLKLSKRPRQKVGERASKHEKENAALAEQTRILTRPWLPSLLVQEKVIKGGVLRKGLHENRLLSTNTYETMPNLDETMTSIPIIPRPLEMLMSLLPTRQDSLPRDPLTLVKPPMAAGRHISYAQTSSEAGLPS